MLSAFINEGEIFEILKTEQFIIGSKSRSRFTKLIEWKINLQIINPLPVDLKKKLKSKFTSLSSKWKSLKGGRPRLNFIENIKTKVTCINDINEYVASNEQVYNATTPSDNVSSPVSSLDPVTIACTSNDQYSVSSSNSHAKCPFYELSNETEKKCIFYYLLV